MLDEVLKSEGAPLRKVDRSVKDIHGAVQGVMKEVRGLKYWDENLKGQWSGPLGRLAKEKELKVNTQVSGVVFTSEVKPVSDGSSWFPKSAKSCSLFPVVPLLQVVQLVASRGGLMRLKKRR